MAEKQHTKAREQATSALEKIGQIIRFTQMPASVYLLIGSMVYTAACKDDRANQFFTSAQEIVRSNGKVELIGPLPAPMEKRAGRHRFQIHVKSDSRPALQHFLQNFVAQIEGAKLPAQTRWALDVDPQDLI